MLRLVCSVTWTRLSRSCCYQDSHKRSSLLEPIDNAKWAHHIQSFVSWPKTRGEQEQKQDQDAQRHYRISYGQLRGGELRWRSRSKCRIDQSAHEYSTRSWNNKNCVAWACVDSTRGRNIRTANFGELKVRSWISWQMFILILAFNIVLNFK